MSGSTGSSRFAREVDRGRLARLEVSRVHPEPGVRPRQKRVRGPRLTEIPQPGVQVPLGNIRGNAVRRGREPRRPAGQPGPRRPGLEHRQVDVRRRRVGERLRIVRSDRRPPVQELRPRREGVVAPRRPVRPQCVHPQPLRAVPLPRVQCRSRHEEREQEGEREKRRGGAKPRLLSPLPLCSSALPLACQAARTPGPSMRPRTRRRPPPAPPPPGCAARSPRPRAPRPPPARTTPRAATGRPSGPAAAGSRGPPRPAPRPPAPPSAPDG